MDISILITNHNYDCTSLLKQLHNLIGASEQQCEIIVIDDCSSSGAMLDANIRTAQSLSGCRYIVNERNEGAAVCRNRLVQMAQGEWVIFIDSDAAVGTNTHFIDKYWKNRHKADVVVGGLLHPDTNTDDKRSLRFKYEKQADKHRSAKERALNPYDKFTAFNVMAKRSAFDKIRFDESCKEYGYEDALFGLELKEKEISISHIDNPLVHMGLDTNERFLEKTDISLKTLIQLQSQGKMLTGSRVGDMAKKIERLRLQGVYLWLFRVFEKQIIRNLLSRNPSLFLFSLYKLGRYISLNP